MRFLDRYELMTVSGGDNWGSEEENEGNGSSGSYNTGSSGIFGTPPANGVDNSSDCKTDAGTGAGLGAAFGGTIGASLGGPLGSLFGMGAGALGGEYLALRYSSGCRPRRTP
jgi:hypothetical protein